MWSLEDNTYSNWFLTRQYGLAADGSSDKDDKFLPVLERHGYKDSGLVA